MVSKIEDRLALMTRLARTVQGFIQGGIPQKRYGRLQKSIKFIVNRDRLIIYSTYYWIRFLNDGRGPVKASPNGPPLIFYKDPLEDPRIAADYPRKPKNIIRLTADQLRQDRKAGKIIFARSVKGVAAKRFIEAGILKFRKQAGDELRALVKGRTRSLIRRAGSRTRLSVVI